MPVEDAILSWIPTNQLMIANQKEVLQMKDAIQMIVNLRRAKRNRYKALTKRLSKQENLKKVNKIQSVFRGHVVRQRHRQAIDKIRRDAPKKTKKYQKISKLQANIKGWLFRQRRAKLLAKLGQG